MYIILIYREINPIPNVFDRYSYSAKYFYHFILYSGRSLGIFFLNCILYIIIIVAMIENIFRCGYRFSDPHCSINLLLIPCCIPEKR